MILSETLKLLRFKEKNSGSLLNFALSLKRYRRNSNAHILTPSDAFYLPAVNSKARIKWGTVSIRETFKFLGVTDDENDPIKPVFPVTIADKSHVTSAQPQQIRSSKIKRKLGAGLRGLSYIGMIEPGYYNVIYDELGAERKNVVSLARAFSGLGDYEKAACKTRKSKKIPLHSNYAWSVRCPQKDHSARSIRLQALVLCQITL
jgi:hypothetical protein